MSSRCDRILDEMGFSPRWVLRSEEAGDVSALEVAGDEATECPLVEPVNMGEDRLPDAVAATQPIDVHEPVTSIATDRAMIGRMDWPELVQCIETCNACGLCAQRKQAVPGVGDRKAGWLFIGEGPGAEEDARGEPFVGQAGKLLDAMLLSIGLRRGDNVFIANAVKCRPPGNRTPSEAEMAACFPYLKRQIELVQPQLIVLLGRTAVGAVLGESASLASLRGRTLSYRLENREIPVIVTYHPAYLLRNLPDKAKAWEDLCRARALMRGLLG